SVAAGVCGSGATSGRWRPAGPRWGRGGGNGGEAGEQGRRAEASARKAREVVDRMLTRVADEPLRNVPQLEPVRQQILAEALYYYQQLLAQRGDSPALRLETGRAAQRVGEIYLLLGRADEAEAAQQSGLELVAPLAAEHPDKPSYQQALGESRLQLARVLGQRGRLADAVATCRDAVARLDELVERCPDVADYGAAKARGLQQLA